MKVHYISIGGSVMHQLVIALKRKGYEVTGTDDEIFEPGYFNLFREGLLPQRMGWNPDLIVADTNAVIAGMHAKDDNPDIGKARKLKIHMYSFPEYIYRESINKTRVVIGGSHGKATAAAMIMHVLKNVQKRFDYLAGAQLKEFEQSASITDAPIIICEGDEYPATAIDKRPKFHFLFPDVAVITGIARDHINVFPAFDNYLGQFSIFIKKIEPGGLLIYNDTDKILQQLVISDRREDISYQPYAIPDYSIKNVKTIARIEDAEGAPEVFGNHNLLNLHAVWYVCKYFKIDAETFVHAISNFTGASKRLEKIAANEATVIYRDFAHAPSKVKAVAEALKQQYTGRKLIAVLELHTFSSLNKDFMSGYKGAMDKADKAAVFY